MTNAPDIAASRAEAARLLSLFSAEGASPVAWRMVSTGGRSAPKTCNRSRIQPVAGDGSPCASASSRPGTSARAAAIRQPA